MHLIYCSLMICCLKFSQDPIYRPNYYLSLMEFRELTLQRLQKFVDQRFFSTFDYLRGMCYKAILLTHCGADNGPKE